MRALWCTLLFMGCQPMEAGKPFDAVTLDSCLTECPVCPDQEVATEVEPLATDPSEDGSQAEDQLDKVESVGTEGDPFAAAIQAQEERPVDETPDEPTSAPATDAWASPLTGPNWGVRLVSVVPGATPPQAVLGLSDGSSEVVRAGDMLPDVGVVVIAIGKDRVQLAQVKAAGDHATVESIQLNAMYPVAQ